MNSLLSYYIKNIPFFYAGPFKRLPAPYGGDYKYYDYTRPVEHLLYLITFRMLQCDKYSRKNLYLSAAALIQFSLTHRPYISVLPYLLYKSHMA